MMEVFLQRDHKSWFSGPPWGSPRQTQGILEMVTAEQSASSSARQRTATTCLVRTRTCKTPEQETTLLQLQNPSISSPFGRPLDGHRKFHRRLPNLSTAFNALELRPRQHQAWTRRHSGIFRGRIHDTGWAFGGLQWVDQYGLRFRSGSRGKGIVGGEEWIYDYLRYVVAPWPSGVESGGRRSPDDRFGRSPHSCWHGDRWRRVVAQWIAVRQNDPS